MTTTTTPVTIWARTEDEAFRLADWLDLDYSDGPTLLDVASIDGRLPFTFGVTVDAVDLDAVGIASD
jgi:hypothetical protein